MPDGVDADFREVEKLAASLGRASSAMIAAAVPVVAKGALNIKNDTRKNMSDHPTWRRLAQTVNYDQRGLEAVVGYDDTGQGELAGIYEFGSPTKDPHPTLYPAAGREAPNFEKAIAAVAAKVAGDVL